MAFVYFDTPISLGSFPVNSWYDCNISAYVGASAKACILAVKASGFLGLRANGSTDYSKYSVEADTMREHIVKLDSSKIFEIYIGTTYTVQLIGYIDDGIEMYVNKPSPSFTPYSTYVDVDLNVNQGAKAAILLLLNAGYLGFVRCNGSTQNYASSPVNGFSTVVVPVDENEIFELRNGGAQIIYISGYITDDTIIWHVNPVQISSNNASWYDYTLTEGGGAFVQTVTATSSDISVRKKGSDFNLTGKSGAQNSYFCGADGDKNIQLYSPSSAILALVGEIALPTITNSLIGTSASISQTLADLFFNRISGVVEGTATAQANPSLTRLIAAIINTSSQYNGELNITRNIAAQIGGASSIVSVLLNGNYLKSVVTAQSANQAILQISRLLGVDINGASGANSILTIQRYLTALSQAVSSAIGEMLVERNISGESNAVSGLQVDETVFKNLGIEIDSVSNASGILSLYNILLGIVNGVSEIDGCLSLENLLKANLEGISNNNARLIVVGLIRSYQVVLTLQERIATVEVQEWHL